MFSPTGRWAATGRAFRVPLAIVASAVLVGVVLGGVADSVVGGGTAGSTPVGGVRVGGSRDSSRLLQAAAASFGFAVRAGAAVEAAAVPEFDKSVLMVSTRGGRSPAAGETAFPALVVQGLVPVLCSPTVSGATGADGRGPAGGGAIPEKLFL